MTEKTKKVLFLRFSSLGDIIIANYSAMRIKEKHPEYELIWLVDSIYSDIVRAQPWVDGIIEWDRKNTGNRGFLKTLQNVRRMGFDILVDMHATDRSSLFSFLSGIKKRYALHRHFPLAHTDFGLDDLLDSSLKISSCPSYLTVPETESSSSITRKEGYKYIGLAIGASTPRKRWSVSRWIEFCRLALEEEYCLYLFGGGSDESDMADEIVAAAPSSNIINMVGKTTMLSLIALINEMDVVISGDTGAMHIARALGIPVVGLFGPTRPCVDTENYIESLGEYFECEYSSADAREKSCRPFDEIEAPPVFDAAKRLASKR